MTWTDRVGRRVKLRDLHIVLAVAEAGSMTRAAEELAVSYPAIVTELRSLGVFATWQAERAVGDHDRNTLRLRLDPQDDAAGFEPGMTVWLSR
jgi:HlyD family secretion protein